MGRNRVAKGFTLIELMVTLSVLAVMLALAVPSFRFLNNKSRVTGPANELVASLQLARSEAVRRNSRVVLCSSANGTGCSGSSDWAGWIVFADDNSDGAVNGTEAVLKAYTVQPPATVLSSAAIANGSVVIRSDGFARTGAGALLQGTIATCVETDSPADNVREVNIGSGARIFIQRVDGGGACNAPADT